MKTARTRAEERSLANYLKNHVKSLMKNDAGFSLLELVVAVGVLLIASVTAGTLINSGVQKANKQSALEIAVNEGYASAVKAVMDFDENTTVVSALAEIESRNFDSGQILLEQVGEAKHQDELCIKGTWFDDPSITLTKGACGTYTPPTPVEPPPVNVPVVSSLRYVCDTDVSGDLPIVGASELTRVRVIETSNGSASNAVYNSSTKAYQVTMKAGVEYEVRISGTFAKLSSVFGTSDDRTAFNNCLTAVQKLDEKSGITEIGKIGGAKFTDVPDTIPSTVTSVRYLFRDAVVFNDPDVAKWNVSNITDFWGMFYGAKAFNQDLDKWEFTEVPTRNVNVRAMFYGASNFNGDISTWNTKRFNTLQSIFGGASNFNQDLSGWDTSNVSVLSIVFSGAKNFNNGDIHGGSSKPLTWDTSKVTTMDRMFYDTSFNQDISEFNTSSVTNMSLMFSNSPFNQPIDTWTDDSGIKRWDVSKVENFDRTFSTAKSFNQPLDNWNVSKAKTTKRMFINATSFNNGDPAGVDSDTTSKIRSWKLTSATDLSFMFYEASSFNQELSGWGFNVSEPVTMEAMFAYATNFNSGVTPGQYSNKMDWNANTVMVTDMSFMFYKATSYNQLVRTFYLDNVVTMQGMFKGATSFNAPTHSNDTNVQRWNTSNVENMSEMFNGATSFNQDVSSWNVSNVKNMRMMFKNAATFNNENQPLTSWNNRLSNVQNMAYMFSGASSFAQDLSTWHVPNVSVRAGFYDNPAKSPTWVIPETSDPGGNVEAPEPKV